MAQATTVTLDAGVWTELTNADATAVTFQSVGSHEVKLKGTAGQLQPSNDLGAFVYPYPQGAVNIALADVFLGVPGVNRLWAKSSTGGAVVIHHA